MTDFPGILDTLPHATLSSGGSSSPFFDTAFSSGQIGNTTVNPWLTANTAIYIPVILQVPATVYQMAFIVATQSGNIDVGIYDENAVRLVSSGSTAVGAAGIQLVNIADTALTPGVYFLAMNCDNTTAVFNHFALHNTVGHCAGVCTQAVGAVTLPNPATFTGGGADRTPALTASLVATI